MKFNTSLKHLFISKTRIKLLNELFYFPQELYYVRQLVRLVDEEINSVRRELDNLSKAGILLSEKRGNRLFYWTNPENDMFYEILTMTHKTHGLGKLISSQKEKIGNLKFLIYSSDFLMNRSKSGSVDFILVGNKISLKDLDPIIKQEEELRHREINYMVMDKSEFSLRKTKRDPFLVDFFLNSPVTIIGNAYEITNL